MLDDFSTKGMQQAGSIYTGLTQHLQDPSHQQQYFDRKSGLTFDEYTECLKRSTTLYIGNLSFFTPESTLYSYFSLFGHVKRLVIGLNKKT